MTLTAEDFKNVRFAERVDSHSLACRSRFGTWWTCHGSVCSDSEIAAMGYTPIIEKPERAVDMLAQAWETGEVVTPGNLPKKGDEVLKMQEERDDWSVWVQESDMVAYYGNMDQIRVISKQTQERRKEEKLAEVLGPILESLNEKKVKWLVENLKDDIINE